MPTVNKSSARTLTFAQVRILKLLLKAGPRTRQQIREHANVSQPGAEIGALNAEDVKSADSLLGRRMVKYSADSLDGEPSYEITKAGRDALDHLNRDYTWPFGH